MLSCALFSIFRVPVAQTILSIPPFLCPTDTVSIVNHPKHSASPSWEKKHKYFSCFFFCPILTAVNLEWVLNDFMYWCLQKGRAHLEGELNATSARDSGDPGAQACHNNLFEDDVVIWSVALGLVVPVVTYNDSGFLIYTPELHKITFLGFLRSNGEGGKNTWDLEQILYVFTLPAGTDILPCSNSLI